MHAGPFRCAAKIGFLEPFSPQLWREAIKLFEGRTVYVTFEDEARARTSSQNRYWFGIVVPAIGECWKREKGWAAVPDKGVIHDALVRALFGTTETPLGPARRSSRDLTTQQFTDLIEWTRDYAREKYAIEIPSPGGEPA
jgi:hypothetical protein